MKIVLASQSLRRKEILEKHGYQVLVDVSHVNEQSIKIYNIKKFVMELAKLKAKTVAKKHKDSIIIAGDTLISYKDEKIGQPKNKDEALKTIKKLVGKTHSVYSGICIINTSNNKVIQDFEKSIVKLNKVSDDVIKKYIDSEHWVGKAGAYDINDPEFKVFVKYVKGSESNVKGLPIERVTNLLNYLKPKSRNSKYEEILSDVEDIIEKTKLVEKIEEQTHYLGFIKKAIHVIAIILVPGYLFGTFSYYVFGWLKK